VNRGFPKLAAANRKAIDRQLIEAKAQLALIERLTDPIAGSAAEVLRECASALEKAGYTAYPRSLHTIADKLDAQSLDAGRKLGL
jgi:hypothetical protein